MSSSINRSASSQSHLLSLPPLKRECRGEYLLPPLVRNDGVAPPPLVAGALPDLLPDTVSLKQLAHAHPRPPPPSHPRSRVNTPTKASSRARQAQTDGHTGINIKALSGHVTTDTHLRTITLKGFNSATNETN